MRKTKVLHLTMRLDIGGAETHVVELAKYLNRQDYEIHVASQGGVYEGELAAAGVPHYKVPLHTKNPLAVFRAYRQLRRIIQREQIDIVHAHARIPGFIGGFLSKRLNRKFVTTTHGQFKVNYLLRRITNWGDKSIAVSEDLKAYLLREYGYNPSDIFLSVNGIDGDKFKPTAENCGKRKAIVHVSRLDKTTSQTALYLIATAPEIMATAPDMSITIVGGGTAYDAVKASAEAMNRQLGRAYITVTGPVRDVAGELDKAAIFVGISRAAIEAMGYGVPLVLAGDYGYHGLLEPEAMAANKVTNFTCRGKSSLTREYLLDGVMAALKHLDKDYGWLRDYLMTNYSLEAMAAPYIQLYDAMKKAPKHYVVAGYYGYSNSGDDALLTSICDDLIAENDHNRITILTQTPDRHGTHPQIETVYRFDMLKVFGAIGRGDILIMGGGSLLQDETSTKSLWYYLSLIGSATMMKKRCMLYANGVGPIENAFNRRLTTRVVNKIAVITLREAMSYKALEAMKVTGPHVEVTADPVFHLDMTGEGAHIEGLYPEGFDRRKPYCVAIFRQWKGSDHFIHEVARVCDHVTRHHGMQVLFVPMHFPVDMAIERAMMAQMKAPSWLMAKQCSVTDLVEVIGNSQLTLSMRLHGVIYSALKQVPVVGFSYGPKVYYYTEILGMPLIPDVTVMDGEAAMAHTDDVMDNYERYGETLGEKVAVLKEKAADNARILKSLL